MNRFYKKGIGEKMTQQKKKTKQERKEEKQYKKNTISRLLGVIYVPTNS